MDLSKLKQNHNKEIFNPVSQNKQTEKVIVLSQANVNIQPTYFCLGTTAIARQCKYTFTIQYTSSLP